MNLSSSSSIFRIRFRTQLNLALAFFIGLSSGRVCAQVEPPTKLTNGDVETWSTENLPDGWTFNAPKGAALSRESELVFEGESSALIDTTSSRQGTGSFANLSMRIDGRPFRGKTVCFRAAVRADEISEGGRAQLWFRVDRESDRYSVGAFDNMQNRPITSEEWRHYEIVLRVDEDADKIIVGLICLGKCKTRFDDATFQVLADDTPTTGVTLDATNDREKNENKTKSSTTRSGISPVLMKAFAEAENAPRQPFFNHWLWLVAITLGLFAISGLPCDKFSTKPDESMLDEDRDDRSTFRIIPKFAVRFSVAYWLLYSFPVPIASLIPKYGSMFQTWYSTKSTVIVTWVANHVFKIQDELVPPNGSGDTTFSYIQVFTVFIMAMAIALLWTLVDWRKTDYRNVKDLLRSYLRYVLAYWMLSYGMAKVSWGVNQFPLISEWQFNKNWGDSSPMNVVWSFMGTSRAYTVFAGLGEMVGGLLIVWRRTATLGALVIFGVMLNVMMLNFCYDVPVKLFSAHLVCMALYVLLPDSIRLANVLFLNRPTKQLDLRPPYAGPNTIWIQRAVKLGILIFIVAIPISKHVDNQVRFLAAQANVPEYFGQYEVEEYRINGKPVDQANSDNGWRSVRFLRQNEYTADGVSLKDKIMVGFNKTQGRAEAAFTVNQRDNILEMEAHTNQIIPKSSIELKQLDDDRLVMIGEVAGERIEITLRRNDSLYRVKDRGFRWVNEVPFNR